MDEHLTAGARSLHTHNASAGGLQGRGHLVWESLDDKMPGQRQGWGGYVGQMLDVGPRGPAVPIPPGQTGLC